MDGYSSLLLLNMNVLQGTLMNTSGWVDKGCGSPGVSGVVAAAEALRSRDSRTTGSRTGESKRLVESGRV